MLVFIVDKRRFKKIKTAELIFVFDDERLFNELSNDFKCINLNKKGMIVNENFFPKKSIKEKYIYFNVKRDIYGYFKKKQHHIMSKKTVMIKGYKDSIYNLIISESKKLERKRQYEEAQEFLNQAILNNIKKILEFEDIKTDKYFQYVNNYFFSFYRGYIYSFANKRGIDFLGDIFRFNLLLNVMRFYKFDDNDVSFNRFKNGYLKVLSRLFIEQIHKNSFKNFALKNIEYYKTIGIY